MPRSCLLLVDEASWLYSCQHLHNLIAKRGKTLRYHGQGICPRGPERSWSHPGRRPQTANPNLTVLWA